VIHHILFDKMSGIEFGENDLAIDNSASGLPSPHTNSARRLWYSSGARIRKGMKLQCLLRWSRSVVNNLRQGLVQVQLTDQEL
jgi:hypothetical protein